MVTVDVKNVSKEIGKNLIIDNASFALEKGKIYGLVGSNGSGKSTLLKVIMGLYDASGEVFINGYNLRKNYKEAIKDVGGIVDFVSFYDYLTAYENLRFFAYLYGVSFERISEVLKIVRLDVNDKRCVKKYSLGMKQRLGIAISLLKDPKILILDEPTNGLDPRGIKELRDLLLTFTDKTIIISSHIISEIEKIVDEVLFINNSKIYKRVVKRKGVYSIKYKLGEYRSISNKMTPCLTEKRVTYNNEEDVSKDVKKFIDDGINVYRVEEANTLEEELILMLENSND